MAAVSKNFCSIGCCATECFSVCLSGRFPYAPVDCLDKSWCEHKRATLEAPGPHVTWVPSLGWEDPMEEGMATHSSILAWRIPIDRGAWWATVHRAAKSPTGLSN